MLLFVFSRGGAFLFTATPRTRKDFLPRQSLVWLRGRTIGALRAERHTLTSAEWTSCSACHELLCSRAFLFIVYCSAECATPTNTSLSANFPRDLANAPLPPESFCTCFLLCLRNARAFPLLPAALASAPFGFVLVRVRVNRYLETTDIASQLFSIHMVYCLGRALSEKTAARYLHKPQTRAKSLCVYGLCEFSSPFPYLWAARVETTVFAFLSLSLPRSCQIACCCMMIIRDSPPSLLKGWPFCSFLRASF